MTVAQLLYKARIKLGDPNKAKISDYSLMDALKSVLTLISTALDNTASNILIAKAEVPLINGVGDLPADFQSLVSVENGWRHAPLNRQLGRGEYQLLGDKIYADESAIHILYKKHLQVSSTSDPVPLPDTFTELMIKFIKIILVDGVTKTDAEFLSMISPEVYRLATGRERTELRQQPIFRV